MNFPSSFYFIVIYVCYCYLIVADSGRGNVNNVVELRVQHTRRRRKDGEDDADGKSQPSDHYLATTQKQQQQRQLQYYNTSANCHRHLEELPIPWSSFVSQSVVIFAVLKSNNRCDFLFFFFHFLYIASFSQTSFFSVKWNHWTGCVLLWCSYQSLWMHYLLFSSSSSWPFVLK